MREMFRVEVSRYGDEYYLLKVLGDSIVDVEDWLKGRNYDKCTICTVRDTLLNLGNYVVLDKGFKSYRIVRYLDV